MGKHKHHIIPKYHCKELGIDPDFDENYVMVDRLDHARIHWGYKCDDLEPLFEYITPAQWIIDLIPRGDNRDVGAAVLTAKGELDGIDMSGENNPRWIDGRWANDPVAYNKAWNQSPKGKESNKAYKQSPKGKASQKEYQQTPEYKAYKKAYRESSKGKEYNKAYRAKNKAETGFTRGYSRAKNKAEAQGEGTLDPFLK